MGDYRLDLVVSDLVVVEIKSAESIRPVFVAQMLTYLTRLRKADRPDLNFNEACLTHGVRRVTLREPRE